MTILHGINDSYGILWTEENNLPLLRFIIDLLSDYNTMYTSLIMAVQKSMELNIKTTFVTFDQPLYKIAIDIVVSAGPDSE